MLLVGEHGAIESEAAWGFWAQGCRVLRAEPEMLGWQGFRDLQGRIGLI